AGQLEGDVVDADRQFAKPVVAGHVADRGHLADLKRRTGERRDDAGQRRARFIGDRTVDGAGRSSTLRPSRRSRKDEAANQLWDDPHSKHWQSPFLFTSSRWRRAT